VNFPFICSNIPAAPAYGVYISQLIRYSRTCGSYQDFLDRGLLLTRKLLGSTGILALAGLLLFGLPVSRTDGTMMTMIQAMMMTMTVTMT
jgi:hypothetical protein